MTTIKFDTVPSNVEVYLDDEKIGTTPIDITDIDSGIHSYTLKKSDSERFDGKLYSYNGKILHIHFDFSNYSKTEKYENVLFSQETFSPPTINTTKLESLACPNPCIDMIIPEEQPQVKQPEEQPPAPAAPPKNEVEVIKQHLDDMNKLISDKLDESNTVMNKLYDTMELLTQYIGKTYGFDITESNFTTGQTAIKVATPNVPDALAIANPNTVPPTPGYDLIHVYDNMNRRARKIYIHNQGSTDLFVRISIDGTTYKSTETIIYKGAIVEFSNVYDILIRGPKAGNLSTTLGKQPGGIYTISEFPSHFNTYNLNKPAIFVNSIVNVPVQGLGFATATLTGDIINLPSSFASSVENTDIIYYTYQGADLTFSTRTQLGALAPGDVLIPNGTRGLTIYFAAKSLTGQIIEVTTDTDLA